MNDAQGEQLLSWTADMSQTGPIADWRLSVHDPAKADVLKSGILLERGADFSRRPAWTCTAPCPNAQNSPA
jgi:hypothetical protein